jgi:PHD/YefM family antitoxin component YafN of YafNO toxin-antitoxin module
MVVMSLAHYERMQSMLELYHKLGEVEALDASGERGIAHDELIEKLKEKIK